MTESTKNSPDQDIFLYGASFVKYAGSIPERISASTVVRTRPMTKKRNRSKRIIRKMLSKYPLVYNQYHDTYTPHTKNSTCKPITHYCIIDMALNLSRSTIVVNDPYGKEVELGSDIYWLDRDGLKILPSRLHDEVGDIHLGKEQFNQLMMQVWLQ